MQQKIHPLRSDTPGTARQIISHHFGTPGARPFVYIQAALHAGEIPGVLLARHLLPRLEKLEAEGRIPGEIVVVPVANPIGLSQDLLHTDMGRFELHTGQNFNRNYHDLEAAIGDEIAERLNGDADHNCGVLRAAMAEALAAIPRKTELDDLRATLQGMAIGADAVLDLHCDLSALMHLYTTNNSTEWGGRLSAYIGGAVVLLSDESGGHAFDESCSTPWKRFADRFGDRFPIPVGCRAATVELRGLADVNDVSAAEDAEHVAAWLGATGAVIGPVSPPKFEIGDLVPLAGADDIIAPMGGVLSIRVALGTRVKAGTIIADLIDGVTGERIELATKTDGLLYAHEHRRFVRRGESVAQIAGAVVIRTGSLLAAR